MKSADSDRSLFAMVPRLAKMTAMAFLLYTLLMNTAGRSNLPDILMSDIGIAFSIIISILMSVSALWFVVPGNIDRSGSPASQAARSFLWIGLMLLIFAVPRGINEKTKNVFMVGENQSMPSNHLEGISEMRFGRLKMKHGSSHWMLSKTADIEMLISTMTGDKKYRVGLYPPVKVGAWSLTLNRFGYAPYMDWRDLYGKPVINSWVLMGTFPRKAGDVDLVDWIPTVNLMLGVGYYPPPRDDIFAQKDSPYRVYVRMEEVTINGKKRDMRDPDAHQFLMEGKPENPTYFLRIFDGDKQVYEGRVKHGAVAEFEGGTIRLSTNVALWVEIQAQRNPWLKVVYAGLLSLAFSLLLSVVSLIFRRFPRTAKKK